MLPCRHANRKAAVESESDTSRARTRFSMARGSMPAIHSYPAGCVPPRRNAAKSSPSRRPADVDVPVPPLLTVLPRPLHLHRLHLAPCVRLHAIVVTPAAAHHWPYATVAGRPSSPSFDVARRPPTALDGPGCGTLTAASSVRLPCLAPAHIAPRTSPRTA